MITHSAALVSDEQSHRPIIQTERSMEPARKRMRHDAEIRNVCEASTNNNWWCFGAIAKEIIPSVVDDSCMDDLCEPLRAELVFPDARQPTVDRVQSNATEVVGLMNQNLISSPSTRKYKIPTIPTLLNDDAPLMQPPITVSEPAATVAPPHVKANKIDTNTTGGNNKNDAILRFRTYQAENWTEKYQELLEFRMIHGHCLVPNCFPANPSLAEWVKRQRYQYKLIGEGKHSTMSFHRINALENLGFVWNSHEAVWEERRKELEEYKRVHSDCNVPSNYVNRQLAIWVKRQRRQMKFLRNGKSSTMTEYRIQRLEELGFAWDGRNPSRNVQKKVGTVGSAVPQPPKESPLKNCVVATQA